MSTAMILLTELIERSRVWIPEGGQIRQSKVAGDKTVLAPMAVTLHSGSLQTFDAREKHRTPVQASISGNCCEQLEAVGQKLAGLGSCWFDLITCPDCWGLFCSYSAPTFYGFCWLALSRLLSRKSLDASCWSSEVAVA